MTGAGGFIGTHLTRYLVQNGFDVHGIVRSDPRLPTEGVRWHRLDVTDGEAVAKTFERICPRIVVHLAGLVTGRRDAEFVQPTLKHILVATVGILSAALRSGSHRVVLAGSLEEPAGEGQDVVPGSPYAAAKWAAAGYARMYRALYGLPTVTTRIFMTYGPQQWDTSKLIPYTILKSLRGETPRITSGERLVDWIYVDDVVRGILAAMVTSGLEGTTIDIGSGSMVSIRHVVECIVKRINPAITPSFGAVPDRPMERVAVADIRRTTTLTGWKPTVGLDAGLGRTVEWYRQHPG